MIKNNRFDKQLVNIPDTMWSTIAEIDELKGSWLAGAQLSPQILGRLKQSVLITSTGASTRIEGARLADEDVEKLMRGISMQKFTERDKAEVKGYYELLQNVFRAWKYISFNESAIKYFHKELLKYVEKDKTHKGEYKKRENKVHMVDKAGESIGILFNTTPAYLTPKEMQELVEWTQENLKVKKHHPLLVIGTFLVALLNIHPFQDGNGRLSRVLTNLLLLRSGYLYMPYISHEKLIEDNKPEYYVALRKSQKTLNTKHENIIPWLDFFLTIFLKQSQMAIELLSRENIEKLLSIKQLAVLRYVRKVGEASPGEIAKKAKVARPTVNQAVNVLSRLKLVERIGAGRATRYRRV